jgi:hypothetical protein
MIILLIAAACVGFLVAGPVGIAVAVLGLFGFGLLWWLFFSVLEAIGDSRNPVETDAEKMERFAKSLAAARTPKPRDEMPQPVGTPLAQATRAPVAQAPGTPVPRCISLREGGSP